MTTWITRLDEPGSGLRLAVKDAIDVAGVPTTVGCAAVADRAGPAQADAECVRSARAAGARVIGKTNLHELCFGVTGINPWYGTPVNPLDPALLPGGSSSGSAVAVGTGEVDVGFGTDTGGSVRIPAACCGIAGLKTTWERLSVAGVWPLAPTLDTVGPLAADVTGLITGMRLLESGFTPGPAATVLGRVRRPGVPAQIEADIDRVLAACECSVVDVELPGWAAADDAFEVIIAAEAWAADHELVESSPERVSELGARRLCDGACITEEQVVRAHGARRVWQAELAEVFGQVQALVLPTMPCATPTVGAAGPRPPLNQLTRTFNVAGVPALSLPTGPAAAATSLQLVGPFGDEELVLGTGARLEAAIASLRP